MKSTLIVRWTVSTEGEGRRVLACPLDRTEETALSYLLVEEHRLMQFKSKDSSQNPSKVKWTKTKREVCTSCDPKVQTFPCSRYQSEGKIVDRRSMSSETGTKFFFLIKYDCFYVFSCNV